MLSTSLAHDNWRVRHQVVNVLTTALLMHEQYPFNYPSLVRILGLVCFALTLILIDVCRCALSDPHHAVVSGALDSLAVVHRNIGDNLFQIIHELDREKGPKSEGFISASQMKLLRKRMSEGYALPVAHEVCTTIINNKFCYQATNSFFNSNVSLLLSVFFFSNARVVCFLSVMPSLGWQFGVELYLRRRALRFHRPLQTPHTVYRISFLASSLLALSCSISFCSLRGRRWRLFCKWK
jgi:hypothetical protein